MSRRKFAGIFLRVARGRYAARVLAADNPNQFPKTRPAAQAGRRSATGFAARACAIKHRPRRWRAGRQQRRRLTDRPSTMPSRTIHTAIDQARANARGAFLGDSEPTLPEMGCVPTQRLCGDAGAMLPSGEDRTQRRPWLVVNPGAAAAAPRASWLQPSGATIFPGHSLRSVPSSRNKIAAPPGPPRCCGRYAVQPARTSPFGSPTRPRWARP